MFRDRKSADLLRMFAAGGALVVMGSTLCLVSYLAVDLFWLVVSVALVLTGLALTAGSLWFGPYRKRPYTVRALLYLHFMGWTIGAGISWSLLFSFSTMQGSGVGWVIIGVAVGLFVAFLYKKPGLRATLRRYFSSEEGVTTVGIIATLIALIVTQFQWKYELILVGLITVSAVIVTMRKRQGKPLMGKLDFS